MNTHIFRLIYCNRSHAESTVFLKFFIIYKYRTCIGTFKYLIHFKYYIIDFIYIRFTIKTEDTFLYISPLNTISLRKKYFSYVNILLIHFFNLFYIILYLEVSMKSLKCYRSLKLSIYIQVRYISR